MVVQHNMTAINANRYFGINNNKLSKSLEKLSSGYAINRAGDNAAGLAVSEKMRAQIAGIDQGVKNAQDGISMVQTFEGALTETDSILQRMRTLATQSANGTYQDDVDREAIQLEFDQLNDELNQIADTDFNGVVVLNGGEMADGTKADAAGNISYSTATRQAQQVGTAGGFVNGIAADGYQATNEETVTFTATKNSDGTVTWKASENALSAVQNGNNTTGGFSYDGAVVSVDTTKIVSGDTITINFTKPQLAVGQTSDTVGTNTDNGTVSTDGTVTAPTLTVDITDAQITSDRLADATNFLNNLTVETSVDANGTVTGTKINGADFEGVDDGAGNKSSSVLKTYKDGGKIILGAGDGKISYVDANGTTTPLATVTEGKIENATATTAGTITTKFLTTTASYEPAKSSGVELVEPESKVSQSNSNDASTATLTYKNNITLQVGARTKDSVNFTFKYSSDGLGELKADMDCSARGLGTDQLSLATQEDANAAIDKIDNALNKVSMVRGTFGAVQNRLEHKIDNLNTTSENLTSAESRIRDTDMASEMMNFTKNQILAQASQSMLAQANQLPQGVLSLLQ